MNSVFQKGLCRGFHKISQFFRSLKWAYQRATRGYADCDVWSIDIWFLSIIPNMLRDLEGFGNSYPIGKTPIEWRATLREMSEESTNTVPPACAAPSRSSARSAPPPRRRALDARDGLGIESAP